MMHEHIVGFTLVDISDASALQRQNLHSLIQVISLRANPMNIKVVMTANQPMIDYEFGSEFGGRQNVWLISFTVEQGKVFQNKNGELGGLIEDTNQVPVITELMESITINPEIFNTIDTKFKNTYFKIQTL